MNSRTAALQRLRTLVTEARAAGAAVEIRGGGTKRFYGNPPRGEPLDLGELSGITSYEPTELVITALAGTPLADVEAALAARGQCLPFEPPHFGSGTTIGGMVAAGLAGPGRMAAGPVRDSVLGVTLVNGRAELLTFGGQVMKNVAGYDVSRVLAGSWGILAVICEVSLKVMPTMPAAHTVEVDADEATASRLVSDWARAAAPVTATAWNGNRLVVRFAGAKAAVSEAARQADGRAMEVDEARQWWSDIRDHRHAFFDLTQSDLDRGVCLWRIAVPGTTPPLALAGETFVEWGGAQRWYRSTVPAPAVRAAAAAARGHATLVRAADKPAGAFAAVPGALLEVHRRLKLAFDPSCIFNPGRLYAEL